MATHSSTVAWKIPWTEEPGRLQSMGSRRVGHDRATSLSFFTFMHWRRKWQPTPVFLPGEPQGRGSLVGCRLWGRTESDTTEATQQQQVVLASLSYPESFQTPAVNTFAQTHGYSINRILRDHDFSFQASGSSLRRISYNGFFSLLSLYLCTEKKNFLIWLCVC